MRLLLDICSQTVRTLWAHKLRSFLTMFGIAWGVGSLLLLVGLGEGFRSGQHREMNQIGENIMFIFPGRVPTVPGSATSAHPYKLSYGDYLALGSKTRPDAWAQWLKTHPSARRPTEMRYYDNHSLIVEAASAGLGVALSPLVLAVDDVERGGLAAPAGFDPDGSQYGLIWLGASELQGVESELAEWLQAQFSRLSRNLL